MLFDGGPTVLLANISEAVLFAYIAIFLLAIGSALFPSEPRDEGGQWTALDCLLVRFFAGAALVIIGGFLLGVASLLRTWVTMGIFWAALYVYFLRAPNLFRQALRWLLAYDLRGGNAEGADPFIADVCAGLRLTWLAILLFFFVVGGVFLNLYTSDDMQLYFPYLAEVKLQGGIWLDHQRPVYSDFLIGRGNGIHLFLASFTNQYIGQIISVIYVGACSLVMRQAVVLITLRNTGATWQFLRAVVPDCAMMLVLSTAIVGLDTAKYHSQTSALLIFLGWSSLLFLTAVRNQAVWLFRMLVPVVIAIPLVLPQYQAFSTACLMVSAIAVFLIRKELLRHVLCLIGIGFVAMAGSLTFNYAYIGVGELNPASLFLKFSNEERFRQWSSSGLLQYLELTQEASPSAWSLSIPATGFGANAPYAAAVAALFFFLFRGSWAKPFWARLPTIATPAAFVFVGAISFIYIASKILLVLTNKASLIRLLQFQAAYVPLLQSIAVVLLVSLLLSRGTSQHRLWSTLWIGSASLVCAAVLTRIAKEYPALLGYGLTALIVIGIATLSNKWARSRALEPVFGVLSAKVCATVVLVLFVVFAWQKSVTRVRFEYHAALSTTLDHRAWQVALRYFFGIDGLIKGIPQQGASAFDFRRCMEIGHAVPGEAPVLPLNANYHLTPCYNSPLLPRNKIVHHYESVLAPYFEHVVFGKAADAQRVLQKLGINYFYVDKADTDFFGPAFGEIFAANSIRERFSLHKETDKFLIFTWRGTGMPPVAAKEATLVESLRMYGCAHPPRAPYIDNCAGYHKLKKLHGGKFVANRPDPTEPQHSASR